MEFRIREFDGLFELDRKSTSPLTIEDDVMRDGDALAKQVSGSGLSVILYLVALACAVYGIWMMVLYRESVRVDEVDELDQTDEVIVELASAKEVPSLEAKGHRAAVVTTLPPLPDMFAPLPSQQLPAPAGLESAPQQEAAPIPVEGLPPGWTDDQWEHYGLTWLQQQGRA